MDSAAAAGPALGSTRRELVAVSQHRKYNSAPMTANELFSAMSPSLAVRILEDLHTADKDLYRVTLHSVAQARKVRPVFLERQPKADRHRVMATALGQRSLEMIAGNVLSGWLVKNQGALLAEFLDALKIPHDKGVVEDLPKTVPDEALDAAVEGLLAKHEPEVVAIYLHAFNGMNDANWPHLHEILHTDPKLQLGSTPSQ